jgi:hypothetical protein
MTRLFRRVWWATLLCGVAPAAVVGLFVSPVLWVVVTFCAVGLWAGGRSESGRRGGGWGESVAAAALVLDASPVLGVGTVPVLLFLVGTSRPFLRAVLPVSAARHASLRVVPRGGTLVEACLASMSGPELCRAWGDSFAHVKSRDPRERALHAGLRAGLLEEIERRDAGLLQEWLRRSPSPASDPWWVRSLPRGR